MVIAGFLNVYAQSGRNKPTTVQSETKTKVTKTDPTPSSKTDTTSTKTDPAPTPESGVNESRINPDGETVEGDVIRVDTALVTVPVTVMDRSGRYIPLLERKHFRILENGV
jgi:hypothetical protein